MHTEDSHQSSQTEEHTTSVNTPSTSPPWKKQKLTTIQPQNESLNTPEKNHIDTNLHLEMPLSQPTPPPTISISPLSTSSKSPEPDEELRKEKNDEILITVTPTSQQKHNPLHLLSSTSLSKKSKKQVRMLPPCDEDVLPEFTEAEYKQWTCLVENVPVDQIEEYMKKFPQLCSKFNTKELIIPSIIQKHNRKLLATYNNRPNPRYYGFIEYKYPKGYVGLVYKERFKRCAHPNCLEYKDCSFDFEIRNSTENELNCVSFWVRGMHGSEFKPTFKYFGLTKKQKKDIVTMSQVKVKPKLIQKVLLKENTEISKKSIRNVIAYENSKKRRHVDSFVAAKIAIQEYVRKNKLKLITSEDEFIQSTPNNYSFILADPTLLSKGADAAKDILGLDTCHSISQGIHVSSLGTVTSEFQYVPMFVIIHSGGTSSSYEKFLTSILNELNDITNEICSPLFMIDNDSTEKAALNALGLDYVICFFHLQRSHNQALKSMISDCNDRVHIYNQLTEMYMCTNSSEYEQLYKKLREFCFGKNYFDFMKYFDSYYHPNHTHWTSEKRSNFLGLYKTNNYLERSFKCLEELAGGKKVIKRIDDLIDLIVDFFSVTSIDYKYPKPQTESYKSTLLRMKRGKELYQELKDGSELYTIRNNQSLYCIKEYIVSLTFMSCTCADRQSICKHKFCSCFHYISKNMSAIGGLLEESNPFKIIDTVQLHISGKIKELSEYTKPSTPWISRYGPSRRKGEKSNKHRLLKKGEILNTTEDTSEYEEGVVVKVLGLKLENDQAMMLVEWGDDDPPSWISFDARVEAAINFVKLIQQKLQPYQENYFSFDIVKEDIESILCYDSNSKQPIILILSNGEEIEMTGSFTLSVLTFLSQFKIYE
jgi:hypothetical protein